MISPRDSTLTAPSDPVDAIGGIFPDAVYGTRRLFSSYAGPLIEVVNPATLMACDIGFGADGGLDEQALHAAMSGAAYLQVAKIYDQSGNGHHAVQTEPAHRPSIKPGSRLANGPRVVFEAATQSGGKFLKIPASLSWPAESPSAQLALVGFQSWFSSNTTISTLNSASETPIEWASIHNIFYVSMTSRNGAPLSWSGAPCLPVTAFVTGYVATPESTTFWVDDEAVTKSEVYCPQIAGGTIGQMVAPGGCGMQLSALMIYGRALSESERTTANAALRGHFLVSPQSRDTIICDGDSITWGFGAAFNESWPEQLAGQLETPYVIASSGACGAFAKARVNKILTPRVLESWFSASRAKKILVFFAGTNDLLAGHAADDIYRAHSVLVERCRSLGIKIVLVTVLPRAGFPGAGTPPGAMEAERLALNALIRTNAAKADGIADLASHPVLGDYRNINKAYFLDGVHPLGAPTCSLIATVVAEAINRLTLETS